MLEKKYDHILVEQNKYTNWKEKGYFKSGDVTKKPFCIVMPPPNITGKLHIGHSFNLTLQDIIIRYKRMDGYDALWLPGMDHAGIATQAKIDARLKENGINPRSMKREDWLKEAWNWHDEYALNIREQWSKMGISCDYDKERFTLDEGLSNSVNEVFIKLYNEGLIYRGERIINWDPEAMTALSTEEVIYKEVTGEFYHLKYKVEETDKYLIVATTRPETLFGDTAIAVHPDDERYKDLVGKNVFLPLVNKLIPIIKDEYVEQDFGTGIVKITPAHDPNDFEVGNRHNLERINCINPNGTMNENALEYKGLDRFECRKMVVEDLKKQNLIDHIEPITHNVGHSERTDVLVEPYLSKQWFVKMRPLADRLLEMQKNKDEKVNFVPERFEKVMNHWMEITYDWCISRQLWWGHQIPAWYRNEEVYVGYKAPEGEGWERDNDVLDTWFSSALWPFSTLDWPRESNLLSRYYPNDVLVTAHDIIPFWVNRMSFQGLHFLNKRPFKDCLIHGLIRDKDGRKMSKSLGNGVDPLNIIDEFGCDSLRYFLATTSSIGQDVRFDTDKVKSTWNFINKLWNASRYVMMNIEDFQEDFTNLSEADKWILDKMNTLIKNNRKHMDKYDFNVVGTELYSFIWDDFCDWYIELSKFNMNNTTKTVLYTVLVNILKLLHPFMPYVTEEIYLMLPNHEETIMLTSYPSYNKDYKFSTNIDLVIELIKKIRKVKVDNNIGKDYILVHKDMLINENLHIISSSLKLDLNNIKGEYNNNLTKVEILFNKEIVELYYDNSLNKELELDSLVKEKQKIEQSIKNKESLLSNEAYVSKAPQKLVDKEKESLNALRVELEIINNKLN